MAPFFLWFNNEHLARSSGVGNESWIWVSYGRGWESNPEVGGAQLRQVVQVEVADCDNSSSRLTGVDPVDFDHKRILLRSSSSTSREDPGGEEFTCEVQAARREQILV